MATPPVKVPLAPLAGAVKVTSTPFTGLLLASLTVATSREAKVKVINVLCGVPPVAAIEAGTAVVLVSAKLAVSAPVAAVTV